MLRKYLYCTAIAGGLFSTLPVQGDDNDDLLSRIEGLTGTYLAALPLSIAPLPFTEAAQAVTYSTNLALKYTEAPLYQPADLDGSRALRPNSSDQCTYDFTLPQSRARFSNILGVWDITEIPTDWGVLGTPAVTHANSEVILSVSGFGTTGVRSTYGSQQVRLPAGYNHFQWEAETLVDPLFDVALPVLMFKYDAARYGKSVASIGDKSARQASRQAKVQKAAKQLLKGAAKKLGIAYVDTLIDTEEVGAVHGGAEHMQTVVVHDLLDPVLEADTPVFNFEATDIGGTFYARKANLIRDSITAFDPCGRDFILGNDAPVLLPLGETTLTWTITDRGPNLNFNSNRTTLAQRIIVEDTQPPILVPPPGKVLEASGNGLPAGDVDVGMPMVVDLADSTVSIDNDIPDFFSINSRTAVHWTATDDSGNRSEADQWITVKEAGTNTTPVVSDLSAGTLTSRPVDIVLTGSDDDVIDGRMDPLSFSITRQPASGEFVAPLLPFFINDYRTTPEGPFGEHFRLSTNRPQWVYRNVCQNGEDPPLDFVYKPTFMHVTDDGTQFITDSYWACQASDAGVRKRISKWDRDGNYLGQMNISANSSFDTFVLDRDGFLYTLSSVGAGSSTDLFLNQCSPDFGQSTIQAELCDRLWKFNYGSASDLIARNLSYARVDSRAGIVYVNDQRNIFLFDIREDDGSELPYLGRLNAGQALFDNCISKGFVMDIDSRGNLYANDPCNNRVHKFERSYFDADGGIVIGDHIGWMGKCDSSTNKACDESKGVSKGYSCTDATCSVGTSAGDGEGQFDTPYHIVVDPNDILYVADYNNYRIQRFSPDGTFAGMAESTGTGINRGDRPSFILGNFARPKTVSVNSTQFFLVDREESFVHVFETSPLKDITDSSATVTYVSDFDFHSATDSFTYIASDGLADSRPGTVRISVSRNHRPPEAFPLSYTLEEDTEAEIRFEGDDPDGIAGRDFNGLDTLRFHVVDPPAHGTVTGTGDTRVYRPDPDYYGSDSFSYAAGDGTLESGTARVELTVTPVNDPPDIAPEPLANAAVGFPAVLSATFTDDGAGTLEGEHRVRLEWGDGATAVNGRLEGDDYTGAIVVSPRLESVPGLVTAKHVYKSTGRHALRLCIADPGGLESCRSAQVNVSMLVNLGVHVEASAEEVAIGDSVDFQVEVVNPRPDSPMQGLDAGNVMVHAVLPAGLSAGEVTSPAGDCQVSGPEISCSLGTLAAGESETLTVTAINRGDSLFERESEFTVEATTSAPAASELFAGLALVNVKTDTADSDGDGISDLYERDQGLSVTTDDAGGDLDGDGLSNLDEFIALTLAGDADTDNDGIDDGWESRHGLDHLSPFDAATDNDGDGFSALQEYGVDRDPSQDEGTGSRLLPTTADFQDNILDVPTAKVGGGFYTLQFELVQAGPIVLQLLDLQPRRVRMPTAGIPDIPEFTPADGVLAIPRVRVGETAFSVRLRLVNNDPIRIALFEATPLPSD